MKPYHDKWGYLRIDLSNERGRHVFSVSRLVAMTFIPNPYNKPEVNHIDGNKENNLVDNLEWATRSENERHAFANGLNIRSSYNAGRPKRIIHDLDTDEIYESVADCAKALNCSHTNIVRYFERDGVYCMGHRLELLN